MKKNLKILLVLVALLVITGCDKKKIEDNNIESDTTIQRILTTTLNNKKVDVKIKYESKEDDSYIIMYVNNKEIGSSSILSDLTITEITNYINATILKVLKGVDKEYLVLVFESSELSLVHKIYIMNESKLIASLYELENLRLELKGAGSEKYLKNEYGSNDIYYEIDSDKIYYLQAHDEKYYSESYDKVELDEYVLTIDKDSITTKKNGNTYIGYEPDGGDSSFVTVEEY